MDELKVTQLSDLVKYSEGQVVELPPFAEGQPFVARLKRPSLLVLMSKGQIPNSLITTANRLFNGDGMDKENESAMRDILGVMEVICQASFVEPTYQQLREAGVSLTDEQYMAVFSYSQQGIKALEPFRCK